MNKLKINAIAIAIGLAFGTGAFAQTMSKDEYKSARDNIAVQYKASGMACESLSGNAKDICKAEASGREKVARADLDASNKPSADTRYKLRVTHAEADYMVAKEKCDDAAGNVKDVCLKEAKSASVAAKADAKANMKTANANRQAAETSAKARDTAAEQGADARRDAASDKRKAEFSVAKEKCEAFAGDAKSNCLSDAKARFGES